MTAVDRATCDVLVIGAGAAGLCAALAAREASASVLIASVTAPHTGSTTTITQVAGAFLAAAAGVADPCDSPELHLEDTIEASRGLAERALVEHRVSRIVPFLPTLERYGVDFSRTDEGRWLQFHSPGHRHPRTLAFGPAKGVSLARTLATASTRAGAQSLPGLVVTDLLKVDGQVAGAVGWDVGRGRAVAITAGAVVLASGGAGLCYPRTGLPRATAGAGFGLALAAGCTLIDMEFVQWYPTALAEPGEPAHLVHYDTLLRHGAVFRTADGDDLLDGVTRDARRGITRDDMSRHIAQARMRRTLADPRILVDLSRCRPLDDHPVLRASPYASLLRERVGKPAGGLWVSPAAHYYMGGVVVNADGATEMPGLFAAGEVTGGLFGANRLEGNALTDCVIGGHQAGRSAAAWARRDRPSARPAPAWREAPRRLDALHARRSGSRIADAIDELQSALEDGAGLVRTAAGLARTQSRLERLRVECDELAAPDGQDAMHLAAFPHVLRAAESIVLASLAREESRGAFLRGDFPEERADGAATHVAVRLVDGRLVVERRLVGTALPRPFAAD